MLRRSTTRGMAVPWSSRSDVHRNSAPSWSRYQQHLPRRLPRGEKLVRLGGLGEGDLLLDLHVQLPLLHHAEDRAGAGEKLLASHDVALQGRPGDEERAARGEALQV